MTIEKAVQHFHYKLSNVWNATERDTDAFKAIRDYVVDNNKEKFNDNQLFAKLYVYVYAQFLETYKATVFDTIPQKELNKMLDRPFEKFVEAFRRQLNDSEKYELLQSKGIAMDHIKNMNLPQAEYNKQQESETAIVETLTKEDLKDVWQYKDIEPNLIAMINAVLNNLKC